MDKINDGLGLIEKTMIKKSTHCHLDISESVAVEEHTGHGLAEQHSAVGDPSLARLFKAYFNNKMTVLIFLCYAVRHTPEEKHINSVYCFLDDLYRHMLEESLQRQYRRKFIWLRGFLQRLPDVRTAQRARALELIRSLYDVFGINLKNEIQGGGK